jgi:hypothetical protein
MKPPKILASAFLGLALLTATGCFRVSSDTRALRDVGLDVAGAGAKEKIEVGVGFFTVGLAKMGARFVEMPPEIRTMLGSVKGVECSVYELKSRKRNFADVLQKADKAMAERDCERVVGVVDGGQLIAVYVPRNEDSIRNMSMSVLVLTRSELICATARGDLDSVMELAYAKAQEKLPAKRDIAAAF